jgi:GAF domain-containing protein
MSFTGSSYMLDGANPAEPAMDGGKAAELPDAARSLLDGETDLIAGLANLSALLKSYLADVNWAGFYLLKGKDLVLGPFQGLPACSFIAEGKGVCGRAALDAKSIVVADVHAFPGHIACDSASASEIVIPLFRNGKVFGVMDIDSPVLNRFSTADADHLEQVGKVISEFLDRVQG